MKDRCYNPKNSEYFRYGVRGITMCDEWRNDFMCFYNWAMANGYQEHVAKHGEKNSTIDRFPNNKGNYEPSNCRWATPSIQGINRKVWTKNKTGIRGTNAHSWSSGQKRYRVRITTNGKRVHIGYYKTLEEAAIARKNAEAKYWGT